MILPTMHIPPDRSLIGVGGKILSLLEEPMTVSRLWDDFRDVRSAFPTQATISYHWFLLSLDFLYMIGAIDFERGLLRRLEQ